MITTLFIRLRKTKKSSPNARKRLPGDHAADGVSRSCVRGITPTACKIPETNAGNRTVALSGWVVSELKAHQSRSGGEGEALLFSTRTGRSVNPSNVRRDIWVKLVKRADVRPLDLYSLRHTFATLGRVAGESAFNVAHAMGHSRSSLVDAVYAHSLQSGMASVAERVTSRALGEQPKLRVIEGSAPDVRSPLDESPVEGFEKRATA